MRNFILKNLAGDFEPAKLNEIFGRTTADIENLIEKEEIDSFNLLDLEELHAILKDCVHIVDREPVFNKPANWDEGFVPDIKLFVQFLNEQFDAGKFYLVGKYEIEFFDMLTKL